MDDGVVVGSGMVNQKQRVVIACGLSSGGAAVGGEIGQERLADRLREALRLIRLIRVSLFPYV